VLLLLLLLPQDDLAVIGTKLPRIPQQHGSSISTATPLAQSTDSTLRTSPTSTPASDGSITVGTSGILSISGQTDFFSFEADGGLASVAVAVAPPYGVGAFTRANLRAAATVYDSSGNVLATMRLPHSLVMGVPESKVQLPSSETYYVSVSGIGEDMPATGGYSSYGSLGWYTPTVTAQPPTTAIDCAGSWSEWSTCDESCMQSIQYNVARLAANGGAACPFASVCLAA
jgi:hypothetical protein